MKEMYKILTPGAAMEIITKEDEARQLARRMRKESKLLIRRHNFKQNFIDLSSIIAIPFLAWVAFIAVCIILK